MGIYSLPVIRNSVWHGLMKPCFIWHNTFQHCLDMFKMNKRAKCLKLGKINQLMWMESNSSLPMCAKACKLIALLLAFSAILPFPQLLSHEADMVVSYRIVSYLQCCYAWVFMSSAVHNYWKCYINVITLMYLEFYWYIRTLPWALRALGSHAYISIKLLAAMLQYVSVPYVIYNSMVCVIW